MELFSIRIQRTFQLVSTTYAHSSGIRGRIYEKSALSIPYSPLMDYYFYTFANEERAYSRVRLMVFLHCLH